jgi:pyruvate/2-oxoglutarate/acetoin dehydrogenase E1 component
MSTVLYRDAIRMALRESMTADERVFLIGEDVGRYGGAYACSMGLLEEFGEERIRDTPLSESGFVGAGIGAALVGMRPIVEVMTVNFSLLALDQIVNNAATLRHMSGGQVSVPIVIRMSTGAGKQLAAQHSHSWEGIYTHIPGLKVLSPATVVDARGMLLAALDDPDPTVIFEHSGLYNREGEMPNPPPAVDLTTARVALEGTDVTLITHGGCLWRTLQAAETLAQQGISAEVLDLRVLRPLDWDSVFASVKKTHRVVIVDEGWKSWGFAAEVSARIAEEGFWMLDAPVRRVAGVEVPIPYPQHLEQASIPQASDVVQAVLEVVGRD